MYRKMECNICNIIFTKKQNFDNHFTTKSHIKKENNEIRKYSCHCGKVYLHRQSLHKHSQSCTHTKPKPEIETEEQNNETITTPQPNNPPVITPQPIIQNKYEAAIQKLQQENKTLKKENKVLKMQLKNRTKVSPSMRQIVADNQERKCGHCQNHLNTFFQIDHIIGKQFGGDNDFDNLMALCGECHNQKSALENIKRKRIKDAIQAILQETPQ